jgi:hypothetical protein
MPAKATVAAEVAVKVPDALPLNGTELEAKAAGDIQTSARTAMIVGIRIFMSKRKGARPSNKASEG